MALVNYHEERWRTACDDGEQDGPFGPFSVRCLKCHADKFEECTGGGYVPNLTNAMKLLSHLFYNADLTDAEIEKIKDFFGGTPPENPE